MNYSSCIQVNERIIDTACVLYDCDLCETKHSDFLLSAGVRLKEVSGIEYEGWSLMKIATALRVLCDPEKDGHDDPEVVNHKSSEFVLSFSLFVI
jgi:nucleolar protein 58